MTSITKIFRFEAAHAIHLYPGACARVHGYSYELHVTVRPKEEQQSYLGGLGIIMDFKDLKKIVKDVVDQLDHKLMVSAAYVKETSLRFAEDQVVVLDCEPTAENLLVFFRDKIRGELPDTVFLYQLRIWETRDSYAEWTHDKRSH